MPAPSARFSPFPHELPRPLSSLLGREREIDELATLLLRDDVRLVTLTGTGGVGKTRMAIAAAAAISHRFPDGVRFVALAPLAGAEAVLPAMARALGVQERSDVPLLEHIARAVHDRHLLLVVDNFEHLLEAAPVVPSLLGALENNGCCSFRSGPPRHGQMRLVVMRRRRGSSGRWSSWAAKPAPPFPLAINRSMTKRWVASGATWKKTISKPPGWQGNRWTSIPLLPRRTMLFRHGKRLRPLRASRFRTRMG
ncbi:MAG: AAA family ATPase [Thermomicrobiales bacterium]|nr:AAA family ATPase [Thermomicrobiales bacterium]